MWGTYSTAPEPTRETPFVKLSVGAHITRKIDWDWCVLSAGQRCVQCVARSASVGVHFRMGEL